MTVYLAVIRWGKCLETIGVFNDYETAYNAAKWYTESRDYSDLSYFVEEWFV